MALKQDLYHDYLYSINPIAQRIGKDVDATKEAYQMFWDKLSTEEQNKILEESIISPETVLKYSKYKISDGKVSEGYFSWFTRSQLDLCKHVDSVQENFFANECKNVIVKRTGKEQQQDNKIFNKIKSNVLFKSLMPSENKTKDKLSKIDRTKPKGPPPPPPLSQVAKGKVEVISSKEEDEDDENIPKTGFDFLDNW
ncbi:uncharacterized protein LOC126845824 [Adelges cooleyi]|uniref:uncharacterized protein LOC126845824 n=1 Tax=Adelges cooleyi TaxID=133065 RepID=UPI00217F5DB4|nr:uncharacterized protein LOC126845824 [Adelges cooleyi]